MGIVDSKVIRLIWVLLKNPREFRDRASVMASARLSALSRRHGSYCPAEWDWMLTHLGPIVDFDLRGAVDDPELAELESRVRRRMQSLSSDAPFQTFHNGDLRLARLSYMMTRALQPESIIETGVCYGVTSAFVLAALERNGKGFLHSIDLPPLGNDTDRYVGWAISEGSHRKRWHLWRGTSRSILPRLLKQTGPVSLFIHDSLHTYQNMRMEFDLAWRNLVPGGVLISDDVEGNSAFSELVEQEKVSFHAITREIHKESLLGLAVKAGCE